MIRLALYSGRTGINETRSGKNQHNNNGNNSDNKPRRINSTYIAFWNVAASIYLHLLLLRSRRRAGSPHHQRNNAMRTKKNDDFSRFIFFNWMFSYELHKLAVQKLRDFNGSLFLETKYGISICWENGVSPHLIVNSIEHRQLKPDIHQMYKH